MKYHKSAFKLLIDIDINYIFHKRIFFDIRLLDEHTQFALGTSVL